MLVFVEMQVALGFLVLGAEDAVGGGDLGHDQPAATEIPDNAAEDGVGDAGHGSEDGGGTYGHRADGDLLRDEQVRGRGRPRHTCRTVPILTHVIILTFFQTSNVRVTITEIMRRIREILLT